MNQHNHASRFVYRTYFNAKDLEKFYPLDCSTLWEEQINTTA